MTVDPVLRPWKALVALGRKRGYVTRAELYAIVQAETWEERFEDLAIGLHELGIRIIPGEEDPATTPAEVGPPPKPLPSPALADLPEDHEPSADTVAAIRSWLA